jgi:hypothetical protein
MVFSPSRATLGPKARVFEAARPLLNTIRHELLGDIGQLERFDIGPMGSFGLG